MKNIFFKLAQKYKHLLCQFYWLIYLPWFSYLERTVTTKFHVIHVTLDDYIPFCEYFIVPYLLWFAYIAAGIIYFALNNKCEYFNLCKLLFFGMTVFLIVSTIYPNGHQLRPIAFARTNIFTDLVKTLYQTDTATNIFPSIHVYNSVVLNAVIWRCDNFKNNHFIRYSSAILAASIVLSTMFLKQHSAFDVITALILSGLTVSFIYRHQSAKEHSIFCIRKLKPI